ncbi:MAG: hypothetical protein WC936_04005 [Candidatus Nanoarchaeia archaeon]|jgi:hypothetical protein
MQYKLLTMGLFMLIILAGCTQSTSQSYETLNTEISCPPQQEICVLGSPGLLNDLSLYSDSDTTFSVILRNNLEGDEARNVEVKLKNLSPFYVVEGYKTLSNFFVGGTINICQLEQGVWKPDEIRDSVHVPEPQFISDLGKPFATKMLDIMYPNEEVEFLWNLRAPSRQEVANVAYEHSIDYEVSYDYKSSILQTIYAISEQEYQRVLSLGEDITSKKGTITSSIGALNVASDIEEPVRVAGANSQFSITYKVNNKRSGIPLNPALFVFQYPNGTDFVGAFSGEKSLNSYGYIDLKEAYQYIKIDGKTDSICLPFDFDNYDPIIQNGSSLITKTLKDDNLKCMSYDTLLGYITSNFKDLNINQSQAPNLVLKFLYPINLLNEMNYLYFPMITIENVDVSKYYSFRLKAKYRYSFSGNDDIIIIPSENFYDPETEKQSISFFGDMGFNLANKATSYSLANETQKMEKGNYFIDSSVFELKNGDFLQLIKLNSTKPAISKSCSTDSDCTSIASNAYCDTVNSICNYTLAEDSTTTESLINIANPLAKVPLNFESKLSTEKNNAVLQATLDQETFCEKGPLTAYLFVNLISGNFSLYLQAGEKRGDIQTIRNLGEGFYTYTISPSLLNCSPGVDNKLVLNSTSNGTSVYLYDLMILNDSRILKDDFLTRGESSPSGYFKLNLDGSHDYYSLGTDSSVGFKSGDVFNHYIKYKIVFGDNIYCSLNATNNHLNSINWQYLVSTYTATSDMDNVILTFKNNDAMQKDAVVYFSTNDSAVSNFNSLNRSIITYRNESFYEPYFYNIKIGYSPRDGFLKKVYDNPINILLSTETYYVNHLPYSVKASVSDRSASSNHELITEGDDVMTKVDKINKFIDYKSFIELNEINILDSEKGLVNVFSDSDLIGFQLKDYDYLTASYTNTMPYDMKLMNYDQDESVFLKRFDIGDNAFSLIMLYSDQLTLSTDRLMFYIIDNNIGPNNPVRSDYFNISLLTGSKITSEMIKLNSTLSQITAIRKDDYEQISTLMNLKSVSGVNDCSKNYNQFYQEVDKKPVMKIDYEIKYGQAIEISSLDSLRGTIIVGDYNSIAEANSALGTSLDTSANFVKGVVSICKV